MSSDLLIVSIASTVGWVVNEQELSGSLERLGVDHDVVRLRLGPSRHLRRTGVWSVVDAVEALGARRALRAGVGASKPRAVIILSTTAALLAPVGDLRARGIPVAVRIDCPSSISRPGPQNAIQRVLERRRIAEATVALATGPRSAELLAPLTPEVRVVPVPIEQVRGTAWPEEAPRDVVTYSADPANKGLDLVCRAWWMLGARTEGRTLHVTGVEPERGRRLLLNEGIAEPPGLRWHGTLSHSAHVALLSRAAAYVSASAWEGAGIAQLEALSAGVPLVTTPSLGAYEAHPIARRLDPDLVSEQRESPGLARGIGRALDLSASERHAYADAAAREVRPYGREEADRALREDVLPLLLGA